MSVLSMRSVPPALPGWLSRALVLAACGIAGTVLLALLVSETSGALYTWAMTGVSPLGQLREGGWTMLAFWAAVGALFASLHLFGAFMIEPGGSWAVAAITFCLLVLWIVAIRRGRAYRSLPRLRKK